MATEQRFEHGEVPTKRWVVELILDLAGYTPDKDLGALTAVEPCFGRGAFLFPMIDRLLASADAHGRSVADCANAIEAVDIQTKNVRDITIAVDHHLSWSGVPDKVAKKLARAWLRQGDYLLEMPTKRTADFVIGNPPYIRLEDMDPKLVAEYRSNWKAMSGRADIYVGFYEKGLRTLRPGGTLAFICADRWMLNAYGKDLRRLITDTYSVAAVLSMHDVDAFEHKVAAYPAITVIRNEPQGAVLAATATAKFEEEAAHDFVAWTAEPSASRIDATVTASKLPHWFTDEDVWPSATPDVLALLEYLNDNFKPLQDEATGTKVGIGIATGNDGVYITSDPDLVEADRLLPLTMRSDLASGRVVWGGTYLVNPWNADGSLVDLERHPKLGAYFKGHEAALRARHVGGKSPGTWFRTIDKVDARIVGRPKIMFPDMATRAQPTLDDGSFYPHHNLYWVTSDKWDLEVLGGLLLSRITDAFVGSYGVKMRGGTLRFQAQNLRRIRVPDPDTLTAAHRDALVRAFNARDSDKATSVAVEVYGIEKYRKTLERLR